MEITSKRGKPKLEYDGYLHVFEKMSVDGKVKFWRCEKFKTKEAKCPARLHTDKDNVVRKTVNEHVCDQSAAHVEAQRLRTAIKRYAVEDTQMSAEDIWAMTQQTATKRLAVEDTEMSAAKIRARMAQQSSTKWLPDEATKTPAAKIRARMAQQTTIKRFADEATEVPAAEWTMAQQTSTKRLAVEATDTPAAKIRARMAQQTSTKWLPDEATDTPVVKIRARMALQTSIKQFADEYTEMPEEILEMAQQTASKRFANEMEMEIPAAEWAMAQQTDTMQMPAAQIRAMAQQNVPESVVAELQPDNAAPEITTKRGRPKLEYDGYLYLFERRSADGKLKFWRCEKFKTKYTKCSARLHTDEHNAMRKTLNEHVCDQSAAHVEAQRLRTAIKRYAAEATEMSAEEIRAMALQNVPGSVVAELPNKDAMEKMVRRMRQRN